jgi:hypothetical protein
VIVALARAGDFAGAAGDPGSTVLLEALYRGWGARVLILGLLYCLVGLAWLISGLRSGLGTRIEAAHGDIKRLSNRSVHIERPVPALAEADHLGVNMGTWFWLNIPLALLFFCCWAGIPLWLTLTRWNTELNAKHAEIAAKADPAPVFAQPAPAVARETSSLSMPESLIR